MNPERKKNIKEEYRLRHISVLDYIESLVGERPKMDMDFYPMGPCFRHWGFSTILVKQKLREKGFDI